MKTIAIILVNEP